jgi:protein Tex
MILENIIKDLKLSKLSVKNTVELLDNGATIPFISRYRKEKTGGLNEIEIKNISLKFNYYKELESRKKIILKTIKEQDKLTKELEEKIISCNDKQALEDLYLPYKPKKTTRASKAKEQGLEPLANIIWEQKNTTQSIDDILSKFINKEKGVETKEQALKGALDIIAEKISEILSIIRFTRDFMTKNGMLVSKAKKDWKDKKTKFEMYYDFSEKLNKSASHRVLAVRRGTKEGILSWKIKIDDEKIINYIKFKIIKNKNSIFLELLDTAIGDSYKRLIFPSLEAEVFGNKIKQAEEDSIKVFSKNLNKLLLAPPVPEKIIIGIDPGFRTGCKVIVINKNGDFKENNTIYPTFSESKVKEAEKIILNLIDKYKVDLISIGNGTASRETAEFINDLLVKNNLKIFVEIVSEAGASVYSASDIAIKEFPSLDVTVRGAISIARRLQDPLSELVKIDPKAIGVGQYQHDINQVELKNSLDFVVESCVNYVGVDLNTASCALLSYVSGIGPKLAKNIVEYKMTNGSFLSRKELLKVPKLGKKVFEQSAGFLKIRNSNNSLDNSSIHPESYCIVKNMAKDLNVKINELIGNIQLISSIDIEKYITETIGKLTLTDIISELKKPGVDPREEFVGLEFDTNINTIDDLSINLELKGKVTNVTNFGAFVDIGVHQDGLVHISQLSDSFVKDPNEIVSVGDIVKVKVLDVDKELKRISLKKIQ